MGVELTEKIAVVDRQATYKTFIYAPLNSLETMFLFGVSAQIFKLSTV